MRRLVVFNNVTVDGYFAANSGEMQWAHRNAQDEEYGAFVAGNANGEGQLLFGRITYQMMDEERSGAGHGDSWQREYRFAAGERRIDR